MKIDEMSQTNLRRAAADAVRRLEIQRKRDVEERQSQESRGQARLAAFTKSLGKENSELWRETLRAGTEAAEAARTRIATVRAKLVTSSSSAQITTVQFERDAWAQGGLAPVPGPVTPDMAVFQDYPYDEVSNVMNPGSIRLHAIASGSGNGLFGSGEDKGNAALHWYWNFVPQKNGYNAFEINIPLNGFYIVNADDGSWDSKEASISIGLWAEAQQYNWKALSQWDLLTIDSQNIAVNDRKDEVRKVYYSALLAAGDPAVLDVGLFLFVKARGDGSHAELNFNDGTANRLDPPWVLIT